MLDNLEDEKLEHHCDLQWRTNMLMTKISMEGTEEEKQRVIYERMKKFHLYNTPELETHSKNETSMSMSMSLEYSQSTIDLEAYEKSLHVVGVKPSDINYLGVLFREYEVQFKDVVTLPKNQGLRLYFNCSFEKVEKCLTKIQTKCTSEKEKNEEWYKLKQLEGFDLVSPNVKARIIFEAKPGSSEYLLECAKSMFIKNQKSKMELERMSRSRSRSRSSYSYRSLRSEEQEENKGSNILNNRRRFVFKNSTERHKIQENRDKPHVRHSIRSSIHPNRFQMGKRGY